MNQIDNVISQTIGAGKSQNHKFEFKLFQSQPDFFFPCRVDCRKSQPDGPKLNMIYL